LIKSRRKKNLEKKIKERKSGQEVSWSGNQPATSSAIETKAGREREQNVTKHPLKNVVENRNNVFFQRMGAW